MYILSKPVYGVFISQLIKYSRVRGTYQHFVYRSVQITTRLQRQGFDYVVLCNTFNKFRITQVSAVPAANDCGLCLSSFVCLLQ